MATHLEMPHLSQAQNNAVLLMKWRVLRQMRCQDLRRMRCQGLGRMKSMVHADVAPRD
jgi:hypothetical protein